MSNTSKAVEGAKGRRAPRRAPTTPDPIEIAMEAEASGEAPVGVAHRLLEKQERLVSWQIASERAGVTLKLLTIAVGAIAAALVLGGLGWMAWTAHNDTSLVIAPFKTPQTFDQRGLTGEVVAAQLQDKLLLMSEATRNNDQGARVREAGGEEIKLEIPETGISLAEVQKLIEGWFGHTTRIAGALTFPSAETGTGAVALDVRVGDRPGFRIVQADGDVDALIQTGAERVYEAVDPVRFARWLSQNGRTGESLALLRRTSEFGPPKLRAAAYFVPAQDDPSLSAEARRALLKTSLRLDPHRAAAWAQLANFVEQVDGDPAVALGLIDRATTELRLDPRAPDAAAVRGAIGRSGPRIFGAHLDNLELWCADFHIDPCATDALVDAMLTSRPDSATTRPEGVNLGNTTLPMVLGRDTQSASRLLASLPGGGNVRDRARLYAMRGDWAGVLEAWAGPWGPGASPNIIEPQRAIAFAKLGRFSEAEAAINRTSSACYYCTIARGHIAEMKGDRARADQWFSTALRQSPSSPQAEAAWGQVLLVRGDPDGAIKKLVQANRKGPRYGDPLELWGEALLAKGEAKGAAAKFSQASIYTPRWGRLHLMWSRALAQAGDAAGAAAHERMAHRLDLTPAVPIYDH